MLPIVFVSWQSFLMDAVRLRDTKNTILFIHELREEIWPTIRIHCCCAFDVLWNPVAVSNGYRHHVCGPSDFIQHSVGGSVPDFLLLTRAEV